MWGRDKRANIVILECFNCGWEGGEVRRWEGSELVKWEGGRVVKG